jgi:hypothetical protein
MEDDDGLESERPRRPCAPLAFSNPTANATAGTQYIIYQGFTPGQGGNGTLHLFEWDSSGWHYGGEGV